MMRAKLPILDDVPHSRVDEIIWGHRLRQDQTAWLLMLEMLNVAQACLASSKDNPLIDMGRADAPLVHAEVRLRFRNLLFLLNQKAAELASAVEDRSLSSEEAWSEWLTYAKGEYDGPSGADYSQLRDRFDDFLQFERAIDLVRSTSITDLDGAKGIYNRFIFPMGTDALYWEVAMKKDGDERVIDKTFNAFTRAGTLLHIMLSRSSSVSSLRPLLTEFLQRDSQARRLVKLLQVEETERRDVAKSYLPYETHPRFDLLGEDFVNILGLKSPDNDKLNWLVPLSALHLSLYHAEAAREHVAGGALSVPMITMVCEIVASRKTVVRQVSLDSLDSNSDLARRAVDVELRNVFESEEWKGISSSTTLSPEERMDRAFDFVMTALCPQGGDLEEFRATGQIDLLLNEATRFFRDRHAREFSRVHCRYGQEAGLVSKRGTNRLRYAPTDQLLQSLVLANVQTECPLEEFLDRLFDRYGMVIGPRNQAALERTGNSELSKTVSGQAFRKNQTRFESRLKSMGMLRRLSDSQAYVLNPLQQA